MWDEFYGEFGVFIFQISTLNITKKSIRRVLMYNCCTVYKMHGERTAHKEKPSMVPSKKRKLLGVS
jgi:hypothetical protein